MKRMKVALWYVIEPLMMKNSSYCFGFYKALIEKIKNCKNALDPQNEVMNKVNFINCSKFCYAISNLAELERFCLKFFC